MSYKKDMAFYFGCREGACHCTATTVHSVAVAAHRVAALIHNIVALIYGVFERQKQANNSGQEVSKLQKDRENPVKTGKSCGKKYRVFGILNGSFLDMVSNLGNAEKMWFSDISPPKIIPKSTAATVKKGKGADYG